MADEPTHIDVTHGPYAGRRLMVSAKDAKQAISEGWAVDPYADPSTGSGEEPKQLSDDERAKLVERAEAGARRLRGEEDRLSEGKPARGEQEEKPATRTVEAEKPAEYQTRASKAKGDK